MKLGPDMYQLNTFNITKMGVSMDGWGGGRNQKTIRNYYEIQRKTSLENAKEIEIFHCQWMTSNFSIFLTWGRGH